jgi:protein involved in polysaccharide export with SLBB domain
MRLNFIFYFVLTGLVLLSSLSFAQIMSNTDVSKLKVNQLTDKQIIEYIDKAKASGLSEPQVVDVLQQKGLPVKEADELKRRLTIINSGGKSNSGTMPQAIKKDSTNYSRDTTVIKNSTFLKRQLTTYGYDYFNNPNLQFEPNIRIATPRNYILGPDDNINVIITGLNEISSKNTISPDGYLQIPRAGLVYLNGLTIEQATSKIKSKLLPIYPALATGQTQLNITLGNVRTIRVSIIGEVEKPGTYSVSSLSTLPNALYYSGGPSSRGSLRNIEIIRANKVVRTVDFYTFLQTGLLQNDIRLEDQDIIRFPIYKKRVSIDGEVKRPGLYELKDTETLSDLIQFAGGFSDNAYKLMAKVAQVGDKERSVKDVSADLFDRFTLRNADQVVFEPILLRFSNRVVIDGAVYRPGIFELTPGLTLKQLIQNADGLRDDAFLSSGYIKRIQPDLNKTMISFDLSKILNGSQSDIPLTREDSIVIRSKNDLKDEQFISIGGNIRTPGTFVYRRGMTIADIISMAGGFTNEAANHRVEISRLLKDRSDAVANQLSKSIVLNVDSTLNNQNALYVLEPTDYINVPRLVNYHSLGSVHISGEVLFPGNYSIQRRDETAPEFIKRAGGVTPIGSLANAQIYRNSLRVNMDLTGKRVNRDSTDLILMAGDSISIPREFTFVEVTGAVNNPQLLSYKNKNFKYYTNSAGGTKQNALLKGAYVQYPDGTNQPVRHFLFFRDYPSISPGSKITIPEKTLNPFRLGVGEISALTSVITAVITLVAILSK